MSELLLILIFGHFIADFIFQPKFIIDMKKERNRRRLKALIIHLVIHGVTYVSLFVLFLHFSLGDMKYPINKLIYTLLVILIVHFIIDLGKVFLQDVQSITRSPLFSVLLYVIDQALHIITIYYVLIYFGLIDYERQNLFRFLDNIFFNEITFFSSIDKVALMGSLIIFNTFFSAYLLEMLLKKIKPDGSFIDTKKETQKTTNYTNKSIDSIRTTEELTTGIVFDETTTEIVYNETSIEIGKYIGMLERLLIMFLIAANAFSGITFLVAIKALTRFKQFDDKSFAEYYLIGSLLSLLIGIVSGYFAIQILK